MGDVKNSNPTEEKWYFKSSVVWLGFFLVGPLALPLLWFSPHFSRKSKVFITILTLVLAYFVTVALAHLTQTLLTLYRQIQ